MHDSGQRLNNTAITNKQLSSNGMAVFLLKKLKHSINKKNCLITIILFACYFISRVGYLHFPKRSVTGDWIRGPVFSGLGSVSSHLIRW